MNYPQQAIDDLTTYISNFDNDIQEIKSIEQKINKWVQRGVEIETALTPINLQIENWENKMKDLSHQLRINIETLKMVDDRIDSNNSLDLNQVDNYENNLEKWNYLFKIYKIVLQNLETDTKILYDIEEQIKKYNKLGVELGDAVNKIKNQNNNIINSIKNSMLDLNKLIEEVKVESEKIQDENEVGVLPSNNYWAFYDKINVDSESFTMYLNKEYWDGTKDGSKIINHTDLIYISRRSDIYNSSVGEIQVHAKPVNPIKYIYYGYEKDNLIKLSVRENNWGSYYVDSGNCMIQVYFGSTQIMENGKNTRKYFDELYYKKNQENYLNGAKTKDKWYLIASCEEIENLDNIVFKGV